MSSGSCARIERHGQHDSCFAPISIGLASIIHGAESCGPHSARKLGTPCLLWRAPIDPLEGVSQLCRRDRHGTI